MLSALRRVPLHTRILIGLLLGAVAASIALYLSRDDAALGAFAKAWIEPVGKIFLYLIFMVVVPLLFSALVLGVMEVGRAGKVGRVGFLSLLLTVVLSSIAVGIGLLAVNIIKPGEQLDEARRVEIRQSYGSKEEGEKRLATAQKTPEDPPLLGLIPQSPLKEAVRAFEGGLLPFMFFALVFGLALAAVEPERAQPLAAVLDGLFAASLKVIEFAMLLAPIGVFALVFTSITNLGLSVLVAVLSYALVVLGALAVHQFVVYPIFLRLVAKRNPREFFRQIRTVMLTAFATASSNATLPTALKAAEEEVGLPRDISSFVLTVGATANQNGTALFEGITVLFLAQLYGVPLTLVEQLGVMGLAIVAGIGTAGVPGGSLPLLAAILFRFGIPPEGIGIILGIDRLLDMSRTVLNVTGDLTIATCVSALAGDDRSRAETTAAMA